MKLTREILLTVIYEVIAKQPKEPADVKSVIANHVPSDEVAAVMNATIGDVVSCLTIGDLLDLAEALQ